MVLVSSLNTLGAFCELIFYDFFRLETYTLRSGYSTVMEAEAINGRTNACPSSQTPICLVGLRPFLGAKHLVVGGNYLVLLASGSEI
jgi:hypothetical protein